MKESEIRRNKQVTLCELVYWDGGGGGSGACILTRKRKVLCCSVPSRNFLW